jgi:hypothetical protein
MEVSFIASVLNALRVSRDVPWGANRAKQTVLRTQKRIYSAREKKHTYLLDGAPGHGVGQRRVFGVGDVRHPRHEGIGGGVLGDVPVDRSRLLRDAHDVLHVEIALVTVKRDAVVGREAVRSFGRLLGDVVHFLELGVVRGREALLNGLEDGLGHGGIAIVGRDVVELVQEGHGDGAVQSVRLGAQVLGGLHREAGLKDGLLIAVRESLVLGPENGRYLHGVEHGGQVGLHLLGQRVLFSTVHEALHALGFVAGVILPLVELGIKKFLPLGDGSRSLDVVLVGGLPSDTDLVLGEPIRNGFGAIRITGDLTNLFESEPLLIQRVAGGASF